MTVFLDSSAVVGAYVAGPTRAVMSAVLGEPQPWCASALALAEAVALIDRVSDDEAARTDLEDNIRLLWDRLYVVPVDQLCLDEAARLARQRPLRMCDAIHLAAASRLPAPLRFATFDAAQIPVAAALGFEVVSA